MQARGSAQQNQQNQNPNVRPTASTSTATTEVKANLESVLEISVDKRNVKTNNRGGKRKRNNLQGGAVNDEATANGDNDQ